MTDGDGRRMGPTAVTDRGADGGSRRPGPAMWAGKGGSKLVDGGGEGYARYAARLRCIAGTLWLREARNSRGPRGGSEGRRPSTKGLAGVTGGDDRRRRPTAMTDGADGGGRRTRPAMWMGERTDR